MNLTVGQYQELYRIHKSKDDELEKSVLSIATITSQTRWEVEEMPMDKFRDKIREINILFSMPMAELKPKSSVKVNGKKYKVCLNPRTLSTGQYIDLQHFMQEDMILGLHKIMACLLVPKKLFGKGTYDGENHEKISEGIQELPFRHIHSTCVFFSQLWNLSIKALEPYLRKSLKENWKNTDPMNLQLVMDGFTTLNKLPT